MKHLIHYQEYLTQLNESADQLDQEEFDDDQYASLVELGIMDPMAYSDQLRNKEPVPEYVLSYLAKGPWHIRELVALNPSAPADLLRTLSRDNTVWVRLCVAQNPATPADVLSNLAGDPDPVVREIIAKQQSAPADLLNEPVD